MDLEEFNVNSFNDIFWEMFQEHQTKRIYKFTAAARKYLDTLEGEYIEELNRCLTEGAYL
jgi:hypothetical protein